MTKIDQSSTSDTPPLLLDTLSSNDKENICRDKKQLQQQQQLSSDPTEDTATVKTEIQSKNSNVSITDRLSILSRHTLKQEISKQVLRHKLQKLRHLVIPQAISPDYLDSLFPRMLQHFHPQTVLYNGGVAQIKQWKISCYLEVMQGGIPCTDPNIPLQQLFLPLLDTCNDLFVEWYRQQHSCNHNNDNYNTKTCHRLMTFITRYTPNPGEQALLKHVDGAGKVDGSIVVALPIDRWSAPYHLNSFEGHGGGITFWDGKEDLVVDDTMPGKRIKQQRPREIHYETRSGDIAFIGRAVWHQADPITKGTRWALVIFYKVTDAE
jgi:hypothetical protein